MRTFSRNEILMIAIFCEGCFEGEKLELELIGRLKRLWRFLKGL
jgi:hypothetical protein